MEATEKIRLLREMNHWTQEEMAERLNISVNSYARMERGESSINFKKLEQIADIFNIDALELLNPKSKGVVLFVGENAMPNNHSSLVHNCNYYGGGGEDMAAEVDRLRLIISHKDEMLAQRDALLAEKDKAIAALEKALALLEKRLDG